MEKEHLELITEVKQRNLPIHASGEKVINMEKNPKEH